MPDRYRCWVPDEEDAEHGSEIETARGIQNAAERYAAEFYDRDPVQSSEFIVAVLKIDTGMAYRCKVEIDYSPSFHASGPELAPELDAKLLPCPFCGSAAKHVKSYWMEGNLEGDYVACTGCSAKVARRRLTSDLTAFERWNTRIDEEDEHA